MARLQTAGIKERLRYARGARESAMAPEQPMPAAPVVRERDELNYEELRSIGRELKMAEKNITRKEDKLDHLRNKVREREREGKKSEGLLAQIASLEASLEQDRTNYQNLRGGLSGDALSAARAAAPKDYFSGARQGSTPQENRDIRLEQAASFQQARSLSSRQAGIYEYRGGGSFISQAAPGTFRNQRGEIITIKEPIGQRADKSFIYQEETAPTSRVVTGFDLFNPSTRSAVSAAARSGSYASAGALYGAAAAPGTVTRPSIRDKPLGDQAEFFLTLPRRVFPQSRLVNALYAGERGLRRTGTIAVAAGVGLENRGFVRTGQYLQGVGTPFRDRPLTTYTVLSAETLAFYGGGSALTAVARRAAPRVARRLGVAKTIELFEFTRKAGTAAGVGVVAVDVMTSTPYELGEKTPGYIAAGAGLGLAFRGSQLAPRTTITPSRFVRTSGSKIGETPGDFSVDVRSPFTVTESAYGFSRTIQPTARYRLTALSQGRFDTVRGDVPIRLSGDLRYNSFLSGREVSAPIQYEGVYRFGGFRIEPTIRRQTAGGITAETMGLRRPSDVMVLTRGRGRARETFVSEVFSRDFSTTEAGTYDILAGFRSTAYAGSRNPRITSTQEGGIRLAGLERAMPQVTTEFSQMNIIRSYKTSAYKLGDTNYFIRPAFSDAPNLGEAYVRLNRAFVYPGRTYAAGKAGVSGLGRTRGKEALSYVGEHEKGHLVMFRAGITDKMFTDRLLKIDLKTARSELKALRSMKGGLNKQSYYLENYERGDIPGEYFADLYAVSQRRPADFQRLAPNIAKAFYSFDQPLFVNLEANVRGGATVRRVGFGFVSQSFRTRAESLEVSGSQGVRVLRPEETVAGFNILERYGLYRRSRRVEFADLSDTGLVFSNAPPVVVRSVPRSITPETASVLGPGEPVFARSLPVFGLQGITPRLAAGRSSRLFTFSSPRLSADTTERTVLSLSQVRNTLPALDQTVRTRLSLRETTIPRLTTTETTIPRLTTPETSRVPGFGFPVFASTPLRPAPTKIAFLPGPLPSGFGGGGGMARRTYGLSRTLVEVEFGLGGGELLRAPSGGFTGLEVVRSMTRRRRRRGR